MAMKNFIATLILVIPLTSNAFFDQLSKKEIRSLIGDFPAKGSAAELADDEILLTYQAQRTKEECDKASRQSSFKAETIFVKPIGPLEMSEYDRVERRVDLMTARIGLNVLRAKHMFNRQRPYIRNPAIIPCIRHESSSSYPSGHASTGMAIGLLLAEYYPEKSEAILSVAKQIGENRILGGVHHPSDVIAGRKLGTEVARRVILDKVLEGE